MKYVCPICGYVHDDSAGPAWNELPDDWKCPLCGAAKADFRPESGQAQTAEIPEPEDGEEMRPLSAAELSAVCSSLAKGCDKQYKPEQAAAFRRIADWLKSRTTEIPAPSFSEILEKVEEDLSQNYPAARAVSTEKGDRGALRSLT